MVYIETQYQQRNTCPISMVYGNKELVRCLWKQRTCPMSMETKNLSDVYGNKELVRCLWKQRTCPMSMETKNLSDVYGNKELVRCLWSMETKNLSDVYGLRKTISCSHVWLSVLVLSIPVRIKMFICMNTAEHI